MPLSTRGGVPEAEPRVLSSIAECRDITEKPLVVTNSLRPPVVRCLSGAGDLAVLGT